VAYAVRAGRGSAETVHFVAPVAWHDIADVGARNRAETEALLDRVAVWAAEDAPVGTDVDVETAIVGESTYLFAPDDYARVLGEYAAEHGSSRVVVDPAFNPGGHVPILQPMEASLADAGLGVEEAPVSRQTRRGQLLRRGGLRQFLALFGISFLFYQLLGGFAVTQFELVTGVASATLVATMLHRITFTERLRLVPLGRRVLRLGGYTPYLLYEIVKANVQVSAAILHPDLPIEPRMTEVECALWGGMPVATLANSITLTPGTLTVRVRGRGMVIHTLLPAAREGLFDGALERGVRFVFYGRRALAIASPRERGDTQILGGDEE
jgi:multicomponent Na+:H+ antiporter subunit E